MLFQRKKNIDYSDEIVLERLYNSEGNTTRYQSLKTQIYAIAGRGPSTLHQYRPPPIPPPPSAQPRPDALGIMAPNSYASGLGPAGPLIFKESPFYTVLQPLTPVVECKGE